MIITLIEKIRIFAGSNAILFTLHAREKMYVRDILSTDVKKTLLEGEIIEEYFDDKPYRSVLLCAKLDEKYLHVVCAIVKEQLFIITTYYPDENIWINPRKRR